MRRDRQTEPAYNLKAIAAYATGPDLEVSAELSVPFRRLRRQTVRRPIWRAHIVTSLRIIVARSW